jgi:hypothetical protein
MYDMYVWLTQLNYQRTLFDGCLEFVLDIQRCPARTQRNRLDQRPPLWGLLARLPR